MSYLRYSIISIKEYLAYPTNIAADLAAKFIYLFMQICLWKALFLGTDYASTIRYIAVATIVSAVIECDIIERLNGLIRNGNIANDFLRPVDFKTMMLFKHFGNTFIKAVLIAVPTFFFARHMISANPFSTDRLCWSILSVALAYAIHFLYSLIIGMLAFFLIVTWPLNMLLGAIYKLLSGIWIPVTMFPDLLYRINLFLPFRAVYAIPVRMLTDAQANVTEGILVQVFWLAVFLIATELIWRKGYRKLIVQGG